MIAVLYIIAGVVFAAAAVTTVARIILGPSILDRMLASDVLFAIVMLIVGAEMVINGHTRTIPIMMVIAGAAAFSTVAVARYVSQQDKATIDATPLSGGPGEDSRDDG